MKNPSFWAKDVAEWIEHTHTSHMLNTVDEDEKLQCNYITGKYDTKRAAWFLTEDGLYEVLMQSRKPIATQLKKQIGGMMEILFLLS